MKKESGSSLLMILCVMTALSVCLGVALSFTSSVSRHVHRSNHLRQAIEIGDGVMEYEFAAFSEQSDLWYRLVDRFSARRRPASRNPSASVAPPALEQAHQPFGLDSTRIFTTADTNPDNDSYREIVEPPTGASADPIGDARYYTQADVKLIIKDVPDKPGKPGKPQLTVLNKAGVECTAASTGKDRDLYDTFRAAVVLDEKIQDNREGREVRLASLDMSAVNSALAPGGTLKGKGFNGIIYISDTTASSTNARGIRLRNGGMMPPGGITIATDNPCYIQGDYNTGSTGAIQPLSNAAGGDPMSNWPDPQKVDIS